MFTIQSSPISQESSHSQKSDYIDYYLLLTIYFIVWQSQIELSSTESQCLFSHLFTNFVFVISLLLLLLLTATHPILYFRLGSLLSNETIFTFLRAPKAEQSLCVPEAHQRRALGKTLLFKSYALGWKRLWLSITLRYSELSNMSD